MNEIGYHGTCSKHKDSIESNGFDSAKCNYRADHWLGQGVYFFDDYEKALWWSATAVLHNNDFGRVIFRATIEAPDEEVLDLDDNKQLDAFFAEIIQCIDEIKKNCSGNMPVFDDKNFRALFFDYYKQKKNIAVITRTFQKDYAGYTMRRNKKDKELQKKIMNITGLGFNERQICVSKKECIKSTKLIYNEEEEVI